MPKRSRTKLHVVSPGFVSIDPAPRGFVSHILKDAAIERFVERHGRGPAAISWIADQQLGLTAAWQLRLAGLGPGAIERRVAAGVLRPIFHGVYLLGHASTVPGAPEMAALLACGAMAVISHESAAALWGMAPPSCEEVTVTVRGRARRIEGIWVRRSALVAAVDVRVRGGIRVTSPVQTLVDLAAGPSPYVDVERALDQLRAKRLATDREIESKVAPGRHLRGAPLLRQIFEAERREGLKRSEAERRLRDLLSEQAIPLPAFNRRVAGLEVDCLWEAEKVIVEVDGYEYHAGRHAFERDRERDARLSAAGYVVIRVTWRQVRHQGRQVVANLGATLLARGSKRPARG